MRKLIAALALGVFATACVPPAPADSDLTIADVLLSDAAGDDAQGFDHDWYDFDVVTQAVLLFPDLVAAASDPDAELTVFAPNDRAFQVLVADLTGNWLFSEQEVFDAVASLGTDTVKTVLTYHIVGSAIPASAALQADGASLTTLQGGTVGVDVAIPELSFILLNDADANDDDPFIVFSKYDVGGSLANGYIHGISGVLRPIDL